MFSAERRMEKLMKKMLIVVNPNAGRSQIKGKLVDILDIFTRAGYWTEVYVTQKPGEASSVAKIMGPRFDLLVCSGGDGTLDEVLNGIMLLPVEKRPVLGYISAGTTNDFAHSLELPMDLLEAAQTAAGGEPFAIDVGKFNDTYFSYTAAFGAFTQVSYATDQDLKKMLGQQAYLMEGARGLANVKSHHFRVELEDEALEGNFLLGMVSNSVQVAGITGLWGDNIQMDDGLLELNLLKEPDTLVGWGDLLSKFFITHEESELIVRRKIRKVRFVSEEPVAWTKDGEFGGNLTEVEIEAEPYAVRIMRGKK